MRSECIYWAHTNHILKNPRLNKPPYAYNNLAEPGSRLDWSTGKGFKIAIKSRSTGLSFLEAMVSMMSTASTIAVMRGDWVLQGVFHQRQKQ